MTDFRFAVSAAVLALMGCSAAAETDVASFAAHTAAPPHLEPYSGGEELSCDVTATPTRNGVLIEAIAYADRDVDGEYDLVITKSGGGNSSDVSQGGAMTIAAGTEETLGQTELSVERGSRIDADLIVSDEHGELCRRSVRL